MKQKKKEKTELELNLDYSLSVCSCEFMTTQLTSPARATSALSLLGFPLLHGVPSSALGGEIQFEKVSLVTWSQQSIVRCPLLLLCIFGCGISIPRNSGDAAGTCRYISYANCSFLGKSIKKEGRQPHPSQPTHMQMRAVETTTTPPSRQ